VPSPVDLQPVHRTSKLPLSPKPAQLRISGEGRSPHKFLKHQRLRSPSHVSEFENTSVYCRATGKCCCARSETESQVCPVNAWLVRLFPPGTAQRTDQVQEVGLSTLEERLVKTTGGCPSYLAWETVSDVRRTSCQPGPFREANVNFSFAVKSAPTNHPCPRFRTNPWEVISALTAGVAWFNNRVTFQIDCGTIPRIALEPSRGIASVL
jgi:hypothetical protein